MSFTSEFKKHGRYKWLPMSVIVCTVYITVVWLMLHNNNIIIQYAMRALSANYIILRL